MDHRCLRLRVGYIVLRRANLGHNNTRRFMVVAGMGIGEDPRTVIDLKRAVAPDRAAGELYADVKNGAVQRIPLVVPLCDKYLPDCIRVFIGGT